MLEVAPLPTSPRGGRGRGFEELKKLRELEKLKELKKLRELKELKKLKKLKKLEELKKYPLSFSGYRLLKP